MKKMVITLVLEGTEQELHETKCDVIARASDNLVSCQTNYVEPPKKELEVIGLTPSQTLIIDMVKKGRV